ncbi:(d)CMP kinase [Desulfohalovibrio reitneri]|uniref:(d)CMP kinase n=1 Tax=Desulfohalovibrio reitneri TaxID=1307759 RepID=UPI0004A7357E|nr:(d)CMP kinase [Desulfohalovibrio reitneri]
MSEAFIVTIDGPAGVGKTTLAKRLADRLEVAYLDTGAMFRGVAWSLGEGSWNKPVEELQVAMDSMSFELTGSGRDSLLLLNGTPLDERIRTEKVGLWASNVGTLPVVRTFLKQAQHAIGQDTSLVAEGRDMGTVVFPKAQRKFFLDATPEERARRRYRQLKEQGEKADHDDILLQIKIRDAQDRNRPIAPLVAAEDAITIDTTHLDPDGVFQAMLKHLK